MNFLDVGITEAQVQELAAVLKDERKLTRIVKNVLNDAARKSATSIRRKLAAEIGVGVRALGSSSGKHARGMVRPLLATDTHLESRVRILNWNIPLIKTHNQPHRGDYLPLGKEGPPVQLSNTPFKQTMHSGHVGWYERDPDNLKRLMTDGTYAGKKRVPIKQIFARSPRQTFERMGGSPAADVGREVDTQVKRQIARYLNAKG